MSSIYNRPAKYRMLIALGLTACLSVVASAGSKVEEFRASAAAADNSGCKLIPYDDYRSSCDRDSDLQTAWCTGNRELGCRGMNKDDPKDREIAKERRDNAVECLRHRTEVRKIFTDVVDRLRGEDNSDNDPEVRSLAKVIISKIEATFRGHDEAIVNTENRRNTCDEIYNRR